MLSVDAHPLADLRCIEVHFPKPLKEMESPPELIDALRLDAEAPMHSSDEVRLKIRDLLRYGGFKPTGRSKPASEYLIKAAERGYLSSINLPVDLCNLVSLHSGLPISVVDLERVDGELRVGLADKGASYVFNASGQEIDIGGLMCLHDALGPCANAVKDSQRTKTHAESTRCLYVIWGTLDLPGRSEKSATWLKTLLAQQEAEVSEHSAGAL